MMNQSEKLDTNAIKGSWEEALLIKSLNIVAKLKCIKEPIVASWNETLQTESPTEAEYAFYFHIVNNVANNEETDLQQCIGAIWNNVKLKAVENVASPLVAYKWGMRLGDESKSCTSLYDYSLFLACQDSIEAFIMCHQGRFD